jgi:hypothetical protein
MSLRPGTDATVLKALGEAGIVTAYLFRLDFLSDTACMWTGAGSITVVASGDSLLDNMTFDSIAEGNVVQIGDNAFGAEGSETFQMSVAIPTSPPAALAAAQVFPSEYRGRSATIWRGLLIRDVNPLSQPIWVFRRIRSGAMDEVSISNDGTTHTLTLSIESHAASVSQSTNASYLDQPRYDPADTSQAYAVSIANGGQAPTASAYGQTNVNPGVRVGYGDGRLIQLD